MTASDQRDRRHEQLFPDPHTVLVADDSAAIRMILKKTLQGAGIRVNEAANGSEALAYCIVERPALILLDIDMPVMDGITALRTLKSDPDLADIPVLMLTAHTEADEVAEAFELGAQDYLRKPCAPVELLARVRAALMMNDQKQHLYRRAEELGVESETDTLTGLGNRRQLARLISEFQAEHGADTAVGIAMFDIDYFKRVNDDYGHAAGDLVLIELARRLREQSGEGRAVIRWGGEEFVVGVPNPATGDVTTLSESVRRAVEAAPFDIDDDRSINLTVSVGCALGTLDALKAVVDAADAALYRAKESGRNQVVCDASCGA